MNVDFTKAVNEGQSLTLSGHIRLGAAWDTSSRGKGGLLGKLAKRAGADLDAVAILCQSGVCLWGSHGCSKQRGHIGQHICSSGCTRCPEEGAFGEDWNAEAYAAQLQDWRRHRASIGKFT